MGTVVFGTIGGAIGSVFGPLGALAGRAIGSLLGGALDRAIISSLTPAIQREGPRLTTTDIQTSTEGSPVNRIFGRARTAGQIIWATRFEEVVTRERHKVGGKGGGGQKVETTTYTYYGNFAVGLCEGPVAGIGRIWADGKEIDQSQFEFRLHRGTEDQQTDPLIEAKEGAAPAYRGLCYIVFERMNLTDYGNRLPQITVEVFRPVGDLENLVSGVALLPGNEHGYDTRHVHQVDGRSENRHTMVASTDIVASLDRLQMVCPNIRHVLLVVSWFGDDLRAGSCTVRPKIEARKNTRPVQWRVSALGREAATLVSYVDGQPAYGGTPDDESIIRVIAELKRRGLEICFLPFMMMDVAPGNSLPDPYSDNAAMIGQPVFPWRGRISCSPAPGFAGTVDKTSAAAAQIAAFVGTAGPNHFPVETEPPVGLFGQPRQIILYTGPNEWSYRRFILHNARLAQLAGGVESFLIGSEMVGLTTVRSGASTYPFVNALVSLANDARTILGGSVRISYAADWSEYHSHRPGDGSGDVYFHLDPLWASPNINFIGIDNYLPLADWRDGSDHLDFNPSGPTTIYDQTYLRGNVEGGEYFDWFYADQAARDAQIRTPITDGQGEPWIYRNKAIRDWWLNPHHNRPAGVRGANATAWVPQSKPVRFTEMGCAAVDKSANQPNVFPDRLSVEGGFPHYSSRARDDQIQRSYLQAMIGHYSQSANNPVSAVYGAPMLDLSRSNVWCWDTRPWPSFPLSRNLWGDWQNWQSGHWLSGRMGMAPASETIRTILDDAGFDLRLIEPIPGVVDGVTVGNLISPRALLDSLRAAYQFDAVESDGVLKFLARHGRATIATISTDDLVVGPDGPTGPVYRRIRAQETELPDAIKIRYGDQVRDDQPGTSEARRSSGRSNRIVEYAPPAVMADTRAREIAELELHGAWVARERYGFALPPSMLAIDPGDVLAFGPSGQPIRVEAVGEAEARQIEAFEVDPLAGGTVDTDTTGGPVTPPVAILEAQAVIIDGPLLQDEDTAHAPYVVAVQSPFRSGVALWRSPSDSDFELDSVVQVPGAFGSITADLYSGPVGVWDRQTTLYVDLTRGTLISASELSVLNGANPVMVENQDGEWELLQFTTATPNGARSWILTGLLRGQKGSEHAMRDPVPAGARFVVLNHAVSQLSLPAGLVGQPLNWRVGPADRPVSDPAYSQVNLTLHGRGARPLSPVHLRARWQGDGDILLTWIRRSRIGADTWEPADIQLGEANELYEVEILNGATVVRTVIGLGAPGWLYRVSDQLADLGQPATSLEFRVYQISATFGRGIAGSYP